MADAVERLERRFRRLHELNHAMTFLGWDQMVMMPDAGNGPRSNAMAELVSMHHELLSDPDMGQWLDEAQHKATQTDDLMRQRHLDEMRLSWQQATAVPADLVQAKVLAGSRCEHAWRTQRADNDWSGFLENFREVVALSREEARCRQAQRPEAFATSYDALLDLHCKGDTQEMITGIFAELKTELGTLLEQVSEHQRSQSVVSLQGHYPIEQQQALSHQLMQMLGFDFNAGRLDVSAHPFSTGVRGDQRITTRFRETDFADALQATAHETGHASYEAGLPEAWQRYPVGEAVNMSIHESQSLFFEKHVFLSRAFLQAFVPHVHQHFPETQGWNADQLWQAQTRVKPSFIRVEADEVTYPLHVMLRYDIESQLINGDIEAEQVPDLWEHLLQSYLGLSTEGQHSLGCMQDIHWTDGAFGYFPSYTLGAVNAAQIAAALKRDHPDWSERFSQGDIGFARQWLSDRIWQQGRRYSSTELMEQATGESTSAAYLLSHLRERYLSERD